MKWGSIFGKKRLEFCGARSATASPKTPVEDLSPTQAPPPLLPFLYGRDRARGSSYVGNKLSEDASDCSGEFLYQSLNGKARPALSLSLPVSPEDRRLSRAVEKEQNEVEVEVLEEDNRDDTDDGLPDTPCTIRSCPEVEPVLGFCPNCQSVVVPLTKKRPHIRTNPWLFSSKRARLHATRHHSHHAEGLKSDGASIDALEAAPKGVAAERQGTATSVTDSGIFDASPTNSGKIAPPAASRASSVESCGPRKALPLSDAHPTWPRRAQSDSSDSDDTLAERRDAERRLQRRRRRRKRQQRRPEAPDENTVPSSGPLLFPRGRAVPAKGLPAPRPLCAWPQQREEPATVNATFRLPQSDTADLWEVRQRAHSPNADDAADAEVREFSRRRVSAVRSGLRERIAQLRHDRQLLEQRLSAARDAQVASGQRDACWAREADDYRKQLLLRLLASARGQVDRHLDRLQDSYDALLAEKLAMEHETSCRGNTTESLGPELVL